MSLTNPNRWLFAALLLLNASLAFADVAKPSDVQAELLADVSSVKPTS